MYQIIDLIGATVIGGMVMLMILGLYFNISGTATASTLNLIVQSNLSSTSELLEYDFRKAGYRISDSVKVARADSSTIVVRGDFDDDGITDSVKYYTSARGVSPGNPFVFKLYRRFNTESARVINDGATLFTLTYYDGSGNLLSGNSLATLAKIRAIKVALNVESKIPYDNAYPGAYWERVIKPKNLR